MEMPGVDAFGRMSRKDAAAALGYSPGTLANWCSMNLGPKAYRTPTGGKVYYLASEVRAFALNGAGIAA